MAWMRVPGIPSFCPVLGGDARQDEDIGVLVLIRKALLDIWDDSGEFDPVLPAVLGDELIQPGAQRAFPDDHDLKTGNPGPPLFPQPQSLQRIVLCFLDVQAAAHQDADNVFFLIAPFRKNKTVGIDAVIVDGDLLRWAAKSDEVTVHVLRHG